MSDTSSGNSEVALLPAAIWTTAVWTRGVGVIVWAIGKLSLDRAEADYAPGFLLASGPMPCTYSRADK